MKRSMVPGRIAILPLGKIALEPIPVIGRTGTRASIAMTNPPFLKGKSSPSGLRVPSGKIPPMLHF